MFSNVSSAEPSPASNFAILDFAHTAVSPVLSHVSNVDASASASPQVPNRPLNDIDRFGEMGARVHALQVSRNRALRAAVAYGEVMRLLDNHSMAGPNAVILESIACGLKEAVRDGCIPSDDTLRNLYGLWSECDPAGPFHEALRLAIPVVSDNENTSLGELSDERLHLAHLVKMAVLAAGALGHSRDGSQGCTEVIGGLAKCFTLGHAKQFLDLSMDSMSPAEQFRRRLGFVRTYVELCFSDPTFRPNRFPVESPWKGAIDRFYNSTD